MTKERLRNSLTAICSEQDLRCWFDPLDIVRDVALNRLTVTFPHAFFEAWFAPRARAVLESQARNLFGAQLEIRYAAPEPHDGTQCLPLRTDGGAAAPFGADRTFENFVSNVKYKWVLSALRDLPVSNPAALCPLVVGGPGGCGKTHLLRAAANECFQRSGDGIRLYSADEPTLVAALAAEVRDRPQDVEMLFLDDMHRLDGQDDLQRDLVRLLDIFDAAHKPVVLAGTGRIADWPLKAELVSRLEQGLWTELPEPDLDIRMRFLQGRLKAEHTALDKDLLLLVAQSCTDMRRLAGAARRIAAHRTLLERDPTQRDIENILRLSGTSGPLDPQRIITLTAERCGVTGKEILGENRRPGLVRARQIAMFLCRDLLGHSYPAIGRLFGGRDHSTVIHAVKKIKQLQEHDRLVHTMVTELTKACRRAPE